MNTNTNPLKQFYRTSRLTVKLPSRGIFYQDGDISYTEDHEVSILPMTAADELALKNPDALLSGQAILDVIKSCIPSVKNPKKLLHCDIETLLVGIHHASYGDTLTLKVTCPECKHQNTYELSLDHVLNQADSLDRDFIAELDPKIEVYVKPGTFEAFVKRQKSEINTKKIQRLMMQENSTEEQKLSLINRIFTDLTSLTYDLILDGIDKIVVTNEEDEEPVVVTDRKHIDEFLRNIDTKAIDKIEETLREVNSVGIENKTHAVCVECGHEWEAPIEFNPVNFS